MPYVDYGVILGIVCWMALGSVSGILLSSFAFNRTAGLIIYPVWYVGILEMLRIFYWGDSRFFLVLIGSLPLAFHIKAQMRRVIRPYILSITSSSTRRHLTGPH
jgi:hypothetical protein